MTILAKKKRNKEIKELYLSGVGEGEILARYDLSNLRYILKSQGIDLKVERKKKRKFCLTHPDRWAIRANRCVECQKKHIRLRNYSYAQKNYKATGKKEKQIFVARELTDGEQKIRDKYKDYVGHIGYIPYIDVEVSVRPRGVK